MSTPTSNRQRLLMILAGSAILLLVLDSLAFTPLTKAWQSRSAEIVRLKKSVTEGRSTVERAERTRGLWAEMEKQAMPLEPAKAEQDLVTAFDRWGRGSNVELGSIKPQWKRGSSARYSLLECRVDATGSVASLSRFLYEVEKSPLALRVEAIEMTARNENGQRLSLGLLITGLRFAPLEARK
jgi:hypothetical protein